MYKACRGSGGTERYMNKMKLLPAMTAAFLLMGSMCAAAAVIEGINGGPGVSTSGAEAVDTDGAGADSQAKAGQDTTSEDKALETQLTGLGTDLTRLAIPGDAEVLVVVEGSGLDAVVSAYKRELVTADGEESSYGAWQLITSTTEGKLGRKGLGKTVEGDEKTPIGIFKMNTPFGIEDAMEGFPENYIKVTSDMYWNGDSDSPLYNRLVSDLSYTDFDRSRSEHLINYGGYYDYCIDTGYNPEGTPHRGSALFLHCSMGINTGGCIAIPEEIMIEIMRSYREGHTYIAIGDQADMQALYA